MANRWIIVIPFFLSGIFFLSGLFTIFSPLPLIMLAMRQGEERKWLMPAAIATNTLVVGLMGQSWIYGGFYFSAIGVMAFGFRYFLFERRIKIEKAFVATISAMVLVAAVLFWIYSAQSGNTPFGVFKQYLDLVIAELQSASGTQGLDWEVGPEELKHNVMVELPSALGIFALLLLWCNFILVYRLFPTKMLEIGVGPDFMRSWKAPEWLVWPTLASAGLFFLLQDTPREIGLNFFKFFMAIYFIQGLSILSFCFDKWNVRGLFRSVLYILVILPPMTPLPVVAGFLDLWFDIRRKIGQSDNAKQRRE